MQFSAKVIGWHTLPLGWHTPTGNPEAATAMIVGMRYLKLDGFCLQDFTLDFYFRQHWHDPRLAFSGEVEDELCISNEMLAQIWWPDTFFANAKDARFHIATTKNAFLRIKPNGDVLHSLR